MPAATIAATLYKCLARFEPVFTSFSPFGADSIMKLSKWQKKFAYLSADGETVRRKT